MNETLAMKEIMIKQIQNLPKEIVLNFRMYKSDQMSHASDIDTLTRGPKGLYRSPVLI